MLPVLGVRPPITLLARLTQQAWLTLLARFSRLQRLTFLTFFTAWLAGDRRVHGTNAVVPVEQG
jgi:hypothetical protein